MPKKLKKIEDGIWKTDSTTLPYQMDFRPSGKNGIRLKKAFKTLGEARRFKTHKISEYRNVEDWEQQPDDNRHLAELIELWYKLHGKSLKDITKRMSRLRALCEKMNNPIARKITAKDWADYRSKRLDEVAIKTVNNEQVYVNAIFNELTRLGEINYNPIKNVRPLKYTQSEMGFLDNDQILLLFNELKKSINPDAYLVAKLAISTGARWSEAETITGRQISFCKVTFINTKGGKNRTVPISEELYNELPKKSGRLFVNCVGAFKQAMKRTKIELPSGQMTHVLRHTFASHFMKKGNILVLQRILGHASITDTMKYAHFAETHLEEAVTLNPIANIKEPI